MEGNGTSYHEYSNCIINTRLGGYAHLLPMRRVLLIVSNPLLHWITVPLSTVESFTVRVEEKVLNRGSEDGLMSSRTMWIQAIGSIVSPLVVRPEKETGSLCLMNGSAVHWSPPASVTMQVKVTTSPGQAACLPSCSTLEVRVTVWADARPLNVDRNTHKLNININNKLCGRVHAI